MMMKKQKDIYCVNSARNTFSAIFLLLCGDIHPCPGPDHENIPHTTYNLKAKSECQCFNKRGLHFVHLNTRSVLAKIDESRLLSKQTRAACICIWETWLDDTIFGMDVHAHTITMPISILTSNGIVTYINLRVVVVVCACMSVTT